MKDKLEQIIERNRDIFDEKEVSEKLWNRIEINLKPSQFKKYYSWLWKAVAVIFIGFALILLLDKFNFFNNDQLAQYAGYNQELINVENYYIQQISFKRAELEMILSDSEKDEFVNELTDLDEMYIKLKTDLKSNQNNNKLISAMIQNLQLRVEILNKQLNILEKIKKGKNNENFTI